MFLQWHDEKTAEMGHPELTLDERFKRLNVVIPRRNNQAVLCLIQTLPTDRGIAPPCGDHKRMISSALAFNVVKYLGAAYLVYLGVKTLMKQEKIEYTRQPPRQNLSRVFYQGALVNLLNPKTALFFFALLPQFIDPARGSVVPQILLLNAILVVLGFVSDSTYALSAGGLGNLLRGNLNFLRIRRYFAGSIYIGLGALTALTGSHRK
ncbi:hypothetical protein BH18ACI4_BH18ACI4_05060 [soil metagenome]